MINIYLNNTSFAYLYFNNDKEKIELYKIILKECRVFEPNSKFVKSFRNGSWDGYYNFFNIIAENPQKFHFQIHIGYLKNVILNLENIGLEYKINNKLYKLKELDINSLIYNLKLPFKPYEHQIEALNFINTNRDIPLYLFKSATGSGKSLIIYMLIEYFKKQSLNNTLILVPTKDLVQQLAGDFKTYGYKGDLNLIDGNSKEKVIKKGINISTWQSANNINKSYFKDIDNLIIDEAHTATADILKSIILNSNNVKVKVGLTATIPIEIKEKHTLLGLFYYQKTLITNNDLINKKMATPTKVINVFLQYPKKTFNKYKDEIEYITNNIYRNIYVANFILKLKTKHNAVVLYRTNEYAKMLSKLLVYLSNKNLDYKNINIVFKNSEIKEDMINILVDKFSYEKVIKKDEYKDLDIRFIGDFKILVFGGFVSTKMRKYILDILNTKDDYIVLGNWGIMKAGINIKSLRYLVLAQSLKSYISIIQAIGRVMRLYNCLLYTSPSPRD